MTTLQNQEDSSDKTGAALNAQRFAMLEDIARDLTGVVVFPTSFDTAVRLRKQLQDPDLPLARIASIVSVEPLIATKLMQLANSVLHSPEGTPARNLQTAIGRLGVNLVRTTALAIAMSQLLRSKDLVPFSGFTETLWQHSIKSAAATRILARAHTKINPDEALLAGLVHDLGVFYMLYRAVQYPELRARPDTIKHLILQWHESIGVTLLKSLGMPDDLAEATVDHDLQRSTPIELRTLSDLVHYGNVLAGGTFEWSGREQDSDSDETRIVSQHFAELLPEIESDTREMQAVFA